MNNFFTDSVFFGVAISLLAYFTGVFINKKHRFIVFTPLVIAIVLVIAFLAVFRIDYGVYIEGARYLNYLLTPATVCLAIPLYRQLELLKNNWVAIIVGVSSGVITSLMSVFILSLFLGLDHIQYVTLLPKSITTAIGMGISEELNGIIPVTVAVIIVTGIFGSIIAKWICKLFKINEPIAKGLAIGTSSHIIGTTKALEMGDVEGSMSSLAIVVSGLLTVIGASFFANLIK